MNSDIYAAGFLDGEGSIGIYTRRQDNRDFTTCRVEATQIDRAVLDWLKKEYGGVVNQERRKKANPRANLSWRWVLQGKQALPCLIRIAPYTKVKKGRIGEAIKFLVDKYPNSLVEPTNTTFMNRPEGSAFQMPK